MTVLTTPRLILRPWKETDLPYFTALNADPRVMEYFPSTKTSEETFQEYQRICNYISEFGWGFWAAELKESGQFIGFIGIKNVTFETAFTPAVEIGWRLAYDFWGKGYAPEGAQAALDFGFNTLNLQEIVSFTPTSNARSQSVMRKIGMVYHPNESFEHPWLPKGHPLSTHVLYRISKKENNEKNRP